MGSHTPPPTLTRLCAQRLTQIASHPLPPHLKDKATLTLLDHLSSISAGLQSPWASSIATYATAAHESGGSSFTFANKSTKVSAQTAAFCNGVLAHSAIRDDMHLPSNSHIGSMVISAALAVGSREDDVSGEALLKGIVAGYEMAAVLGTAFQQTEGYNRHVRPSGSCGAFGAAAAAVVMTGQEEEVATNALAFAANMASGFNQWAWTGGMEIYTEMGTAAQSGVVAFDIARAGMKCSEDVLEGKAGYFAALGVGDEATERFREWLSSSEVGRGIMEVTFKPVPGCNYAQTPIAAALEVSKPLREKQSQNPDMKIDEIVIRSTTPAKMYPGCDNPAKVFETVQQTKMSIQYGVSAMLLYGIPSEEVFMKFDDEAIRALVAKCSLSPLEEFDQAIQKERRQPASVAVKLSDGTTVERRLEDVPWLPPDAVKKRFLSEATSLTKDANELLKAIERLGQESTVASLISHFT